MLGFGRDALRLAQDRERADLDRDFTFRLAAERILELVGEAARRVSPAVRGAHPDIPWIDTVGMRNVPKLERIVAALPPPE
ncbi:MAG: DUF86 domain-containing protein [Alphaproteobacteria bacterium]|nr:DUF86 domain-containing protein [Alphaproteobacteria bacterium]MCW5742994.1 DUF86 domain-containing protein [Alphaproteobacteria bacterium]